MNRSWHKMGLTCEVRDLYFVILAVYAAIWIRKFMNRAMFKPIYQKDIMAMENDLYLKIRKRKNQSSTKRSV